MTEVKQHHQVETAKSLVYLNSSKDRVESTLGLLVFSTPLFSLNVSKNRKKHYEHALKFLRRRQMPLRIGICEVMG